jgi:hypothetical protein
MTCIETYATLRIFSRTLEPAAIGASLGIDATDPVPLDPSSKYRPRREVNYWGWCTRQHVASKTDNALHIAAILERVRGKELQLQHLRSVGCETDICCFWVSTGQGGPSLGVEVMRELSELGLSIWWDVYFDDESKA